MGEQRLCRRDQRRSAARLPTVSPPGRIPRRQPRIRTRLVQWRRSIFRKENAGSVRLLIVGLAPGLKGANRTGRPFTGDFAGALLYETLLAFGFARGRYEARPDDGLDARRLHDHQRRALRAARKQADACRDRYMPAVSYGTHCHACPGLPPSLRWAASRMTARSRRSVRARPRFPFAHGAQHESGWAWCCSIASTARATTPTPAS